MKKIIILGSTGSIGQQTLEVVRKYSRKFKIVGLSGGRNIALLRRQIREFKPKFVASQKGGKLGGAKLIPLEKLAVQKCALLVSAIAGVAGLKPTLLALKKGRNVALANKESLVLAGDLMLQAAKKSGAQIFPIDSEHSGLWQLLNKVDPKTIRRVVITASGGALRDIPLTKLKNVKPRQVLAHPTWQMGTKITLDCATLANKAFEIIEAHHLFGIPYEKIEAVIHPQSLVHALVETTDGNVFAQLSNPDMRLPIQLALFEGRREASLVKPLDLSGQKLEFRKIEAKRYPLFFTILQAGKRGGLAPVVAAVASEMAGRKFLKGEIKFSKIERFTRKTLELTPQISEGLTDKLSTKNILKVIEIIKKHFE
ncbi:MAG: 1-deoxy-D-xylulose-5-phosphate reductoisomerase [Patescibacteria group bacterium]